MADLNTPHLPYARWAHVLLRVIAGAAFAQHGLQKVLGLLGGFMGTPGATATVGSLPWIAGVIELVGGILIIIGLFTRPVAFIAAGEMAVAYFKSHFPHGFWPINNGGELAVLFCFIFLYFAATGAGAVSLDWMMSHKKAPEGATY